MDSTDEALMGIVCQSANHGRLPEEASHASRQQDSAGPTCDEGVDTLVTALRDLVVGKPQAMHGAEGTRYRDLAEMAEDSIFVINLDGTIDYINPSTASLLSTTISDLIGAPFEGLALLPEPEQAEDLLSRVIVNEEVVRYERAIPLTSGLRHFYTTLSPLRDNEGGITGILGIAKDVTEIARARDELRSLSLVDELTGIYNRRGFTSLAGQILSLSKRNGSRICLVLADLDGLKAINDGYGHPQGDDALISLAAVLRRSSRQSDIVARIGGDEFVLLASGVTEGGSTHLLNRIRETVESESLRKPYPFSASIGAVEADAAPLRSVEVLLKDADSAMYRAKRAKRS